MSSKKHNGPKILSLDIETKPLKVWAWGLWDQNIAPNQIIEDWSVISIAAKWLHGGQAIQADLRKNKDYTKDHKLIEIMWKLLDECDVVLTQGGRKFDIKKLNAKFLEYDMGPPSPFQHIDLLTLKRSKFGLTSNKLEFTSRKLKIKNKKSKHKEFPGMELWTECLKGNQKAWKEMARYNILDVEAVIEEYNTKFKAWDSSINFNTFYNDEKMRCPSCGSNDLQHRGRNTTKTGQFARYHCQGCGSWTQGKTNLLNKEHKQQILKKI